MQLTYVQHSANTPKRGPMVDETDRKILTLLRQDSRLQFAEIGKKVNLSAPAVFARVKKMENSGVIKKFTIEIEPTKLDIHLAAIIRIVLKGVPTQKVVGTLLKLKEIEEAHHVAGEDCLILKVRTQGPSQLNQLLESIKMIDGIDRTITSVVLNS